MNVLFWGTPEFAAPSLRALLGEGFEVVGVVTQPDRPQGRSRSRMVPSPIKEIALEENLPLYQPETARDPVFLEAIRALAPDVSVVVAYGNILPVTAIDIPAIGTFNVHASLLPHLRGAAPIQAAIRDGLTETGVTIIRLVPALDAGPMLLRRMTPIADDETYGELTLRLAELGAVALIEALALLQLGAVIEQPQDESAATYAGKVDRATTRIDWSLPAVQVSRAIRAYDPRPGAFAVVGDTEVKLFAASVGDSVHPEHTPGTVLDAGADGLIIACADATAVRILQVQPAGKARMAAADWIRGRGVSVGDRLS
ncbi:MAG TPA: methionyl-tRNA formyltransferase [Gemmatimonadaceae bacterium]|nr:methionyl-tRNA formyltransferase [Gemmatimonadaceae bacterium]